MKQFKKILKEAFTDKQLQRALLPYRRKVQSKLVGDLADYVSALENVLKQAGATSNMDDATMRREILKGVSAEYEKTSSLFEPGPEKEGEPKKDDDGEFEKTSPLFEPGPTSKPADDKKEPEDDFEPVPSAVDDDEKEPEGEKEMPSLSKVAHDPGKVPVTSRDIPKWKKNVYTQKDQPKFADEEPRDEPYSVSRAKSYLAGEDEPLGPDSDYLKRIKKGLGKGKKDEPVPTEPPKAGKKKLGFNPSSPYLDPKVAKKLDKKGNLPSLKKMFTRGK